MFKDIFRTSVLCLLREWKQDLTEGTLRYFYWKGAWPDCQTVSVSFPFLRPPYKANELSMCLVGLRSLSVPTCSKGNLGRTPTVTYSSKWSTVNKRVPVTLSSVASLLPPYDPPASILFFTSFWQQQSVGESLGLQPPLLHPPSSLKWSLLFIQEVLWCQHERHCPRYPNHFLWEIGTNLISKGGLFWQKYLLFSLQVKGCTRNLHRSRVERTKPAILKEMILKIIERWENPFWGREV